MNKIFITLLLLSITTIKSYSQDTIPLYHPEADAITEVRVAVDKASSEHKNILLMVGGNWCRWCRMFDKMVKTNPQVDSTLKANFIFEHINFSKENRNLELMTQWDFPQRFGFPVFVVLNERGHHIHTQNSAYLEQGEGYDPAHVMEFFKQWGQAAMNPELYKEKK